MIQTALQAAHVEQKNEGQVFNHIQGRAKLGLHLLVWKIIQ